jgi:hypothetical protein
VNIRWLATFALSSLAIAGVSGQQNWPQFRGPNAGVIADNAALPETWSAAENVAWKTAVPGLGWSSPVVWGDHIFLTAAINTGAPEPFKAGPLRGGDIVKPAAPMPVDDVRRQPARAERSAGSREVAQPCPPTARRMKNSYSGKHTDHRRRARLCVLLNLGVFVFDLNGKPV